MIQTPEQLDELIQNSKRNGSKASDALVASLISMPKAEIESPNLLRVKSQILDRISLPASLKEETSGAAGFMALLPRMLRIVGGLVGAFAIFLSMSLGAAVAASDSVPGQPIYPLKKMVENVRLQLARTEEQRTTLQIIFANNRIDELEAIFKKQKQGKISEADVQKIVAETAKDLEETGLTVNEGSDISLLGKIVDLSNKQTAIIQAAQVESQGDMQVELARALESSKVTKEQAIENIEKAGLVVEEQPLTVEDPDQANENEVTTEGKLTAMTKTSVSIGTVQFLLTNDTEYVNINSVDLKIGDKVKISGELVEKKTFALKIEFISNSDPDPNDDSENPNTEPSVTPTPSDQSGGTTPPPDTVPVDPAE